MLSGIVYRPGCRRPPECWNASQCMTWYVCYRATSAVLFVAQRICELNCIQVVIHAADASIREQLAQHGGRPEWQLRNRTRFRAIELPDRMVRSWARTR